MKRPFCRELPLDFDERLLRPAQLSQLRSALYILAGLFLNDRIMCNSDKHIVKCVSLLLCGLSD